MAGGQNGNDYITCHGLRFSVHGDGFVRNKAEVDFEAGASAIESALDAMPEADVRAAHAACIDWMKRDCDGERPAIFDSLETLGHDAATAGWHRRNGVSVSVSAVS